MATETMFLLGAGVFFFVLMGAFAYMMGVGDMEFDTKTLDTAKSKNNHELAGLDDKALAAMAAGDDIYAHGGRIR